MYDVNLLDVGLVRDTLELRYVLVTYDIVVIVAIAAIAAMVVIVVIAAAVVIVVQYLELVFEALCVGGSSSYHRRHFCFRRAKVLHLLLQ